MKEKKKKKKGECWKVCFFPGEHPRHTPQDHLSLFLQSEPAHGSGLKWQETSLTKGALSSWPRHKGYFLKCSCSLGSWHTHLTLCSILGGCSGGTWIAFLFGSQKPMQGRLLADELKCDLAPRIRCLLVLPLLRKPKKLSWYRSNAMWKGKAGNPSWL